MSIQKLARYAGTPLSQFLDEHLPNRHTVVQEWISQLNRITTDAVPPTHVRDSVGWALELCMGLDLAASPPRLSELSYLPLSRCAAVLSAAGYERRPVGTLPPNGTTDPVLCRWERIQHRVMVDVAQQAIFSACLDLAFIRDPMHRWGDSRTVDERRSMFDCLTEGDSFDRSPELLDALAQCWHAYLDRGRRALLGLGDKVVVAPELGNGFGVADLVIGRTLIDVKLAVEPTTEDMTFWLRQLLGYVLLDRHNTFHLDTIAVYCGWHGQLLTYPLSALLSAGPSFTSALDRLRTKFAAALRDDLDGYTAWKEHRRYN